jgi:putative intracellular protease/amidase
MRSLNSLLITTSNSRSGDTWNRTGVEMDNLAAPYFILKDGGEHVTIASPQGGPIPLDLNGRTLAEQTKDTLRFQKDPQALYHFFHSLALSEIRKEDFDLLFIIGGYGSMWNFPRNRQLKELLEFAMVRNIPVGLVGHAMVALISLTTSEGTPFVTGRKITAFSDSEEESAMLTEPMPYPLQTKLVALGALYSKGPDFESHVVEDANIVSGQNPASSIDVARRVLAMARDSKEVSPWHTREKFFRYR